MSRLLVFQHVAAEPLGTLDALIRARGHRIRFRNLHRQSDSKPQTADLIEGTQRLACQVFNNFLDLVGQPARRIKLASRGMPGWSPRRLVQVRRD